MELLHAMKQKSTPAAVVVKSSPRDSPNTTPTGMGQGRRCLLGTGVRPGSHYGYRVLGMKGCTSHDGASCASR